MKKNLLVCLLVIATGAFGQVSNKLAPADKLYGLSRIWQEANYNFVYMDAPKKAMLDSAYRSMIPEVIASTDDYQYYKLLQKFCALLGDGHTSVSLPFEDMNTTFGEFRVSFANIGGRAVVDGVNYSKKEVLPLGSEVIEVNGLPTLEYINKFVRPYISCSNPEVLDDLCIKGLLRGLPGEKYEIRIKKPSGEVIPLSLTHARTTETETWPQMPKRSLLEFKWLEGEIAYVQLNSFSNPKIDSMFIALLPELYKCKALVLDLRNNGGGSTHIGRAILEYLTDDTLLYGSRCFTRQHIALFKAYGALLKPADTIAGNQARGITKEQAVNYFNALNDRLYYPLDYSPDTSRLQAKRLIVPTVILTGHFTASAAEEFLIYADNQEHITLVGQSTFGSTGQPYEFDLPGGGKARICTKKNTYPDGRTYVGSGVRPDIEVESTVADIIGQKDPALDRAVNFLHKR